ncbi:MAG: ABC transporter permease [Patescibacteria group bacterium]
MNWRHVKTVWYKEILDTVRDRRTLMAGILAPIILMPLLSLGGQALVQSQQNKAVEEKTPIAIHGATEAPALMDRIRRAGVFEIKDVPEPGAAKALKDGDISLLVRIPGGFEQKAMAGRTPAELVVEFEAKKLTSSVALDKLRKLLNEYQVAAQAARLGLEDPGLLQAVRLTEKNVSTPREMGGMILGFLLPFVLAVWGIMGGMYTAIDAVAGEKERGTLETLVMAPPSRASLATGKALAVLTMSFLTIFLTVVSAFLSFRFLLPLVDKSGAIQVPVELGTIGLVLLVALPYLAMLAGIQIALSTFGKSFKETQNYFSMLTFLVLLPGMAVAFVERQYAPLFYAVPFANAVALFKGIFAGSWRWADVAVSVIANTAYFGLTLTMARRMLADEKRMFRG